MFQLRTCLHYVQLRDVASLKEVKGNQLWVEWYGCGRGLPLAAGIWGWLVGYSEYFLYLHSGAFLAQKVGSCNGEKFYQQGSSAKISMKYLDFASEHGPPHFGSSMSACLVQLL